MRDNNEAKMPALEGAVFKRVTLSPIDDPTPDLTPTTREVQVDGYRTKVELGSTFFVLPRVVGGPYDDLIKVEPVQSVADAARIFAGDSCVVSFSNDRVLQCVLAFPDLFSPRVAVLEGFPHTVYSESFRSLTFTLPAQSYEQLALDVASANRAASAVLAERAKTPEGRDLNATRESGHVRQFNKFDETVPRGLAAGDDDVE